MRHAVSHLAPGLIFGGLGVALLWFAARSFLRFRRTGSISVSIRVGWSPFGEWEPAISVVRSALRDREEPAKASELRRAWAVYLVLGGCVLGAAVLLVAGYGYLRFGHGLGN